MLKTKNQESATTEGRESFRLRRYLLSALLALSFATAGCSEAGLENTLSQLESGEFDPGDLEGLLDIPPTVVLFYVGMQLGIPMGFP